MRVKLKLDRKMRIIGSDGRKHETVFDTSEKVGGENTASSPMEIMLQAMGACSFMDTISILRKKRKQVDNLVIRIEAERATEYPKVFTKAHLSYQLHSPDADKNDLERSVKLSQEKYCGASEMFRRSGCEVTFETKVIKT